MKLDKITLVYFLVALARLLYAVDGSVAHYMYHFDDFAIATYAGIIIGILITVALLLPLSNRTAILFAGINATGG